MLKGALIVLKKWLQFLNHLTNLLLTFMNDMLQSDFIFSAHRKGIAQTLSRKISPSGIIRVIYPYILLLLFFKQSNKFNIKQGEYFILPCQPVKISISISYIKIINTQYLDVLFPGFDKDVLYSFKSTEGIRRVHVAVYRQPVFASLDVAAS